MANADSTGSAADIPSFRYRVSGMDCAKDAAQIERAAQSAGIAPDAVKVSTATHIMTLTAPEARLPEIEKAVETTGYGFDRIESDEDIQQGAAHQDPGYRRALWIVVILNVGYGVLEMIGGFIAGSQAVKADALDFIGDGAITFLGLLAIGWSLAWRARSALIQGIFLGLLGLWSLWHDHHKGIRADNPRRHFDGDSGPDCSCDKCHLRAAVAAVPQGRREHARCLAVLAQRRHRQRRSRYRRRGWWFG